MSWTDGKAANEHVMTTTVTRTICIAAALLSTAIPAHAEAMEQLYERAKAEKSLVFYAEANRTL